MRNAMTLNQDTMSRLSDLIRINIDSYREFQTAADAVEDPELAALFQDFARQRRGFADELKPYVEERTLRSHSRNQPGSACARLQRWWTDLRALLSGNEQEAVLAEAERGEDEVRRLYEDALRDPAARGPVHDVLDHQYWAVKTGQDRIRDMRRRGF